MLHIYYGSGKGKTTAAVGLTVRACGSGMKTAFFQFLKNGSSSEIKVLEKLENNTVFCCKECTKFTFQMNSAEKQLITAVHTDMLKKAAELVETEKVQLVVLDEFLDAYGKKLIDTELAESFIRSFSDRAEIVITGREPTELFMTTADYITEMTAVKHPYQKGITARKGIEY
ncbi:MAG: cob(I)yrinic acid a,c-diamide adenosyltransferase [Ruminococcus sp.]|uniref:cob(I)yrinic acid a,c-diamide adenosyltransferase n=1 Tax=Ruminococcus sp. TaxID=41978 RepID=UPI0025EB3B0E|nr:cob(I)yrinic acid a,c-diamide adenosyltransferase [Ruminococcus sp.]MBR5682271.1 cob(I)yrinic acid a,c-diamide adenosyltransferase [Ruminococcus sp.]